MAHDDVGVPFADQAGEGAAVFQGRKLLAVVDVDDMVEGFVLVVFWDDTVKCRSDKVNKERLRCHLFWRHKPPRQILRSVTPVRSSHSCRRAATTALPRPPRFGPLIYGSVAGSVCRV